MHKNVILTQELCVVGLRIEILTSKRLWYEFVSSTEISINIKASWSNVRENTYV